MTCEVPVQSINEHFVDVNKTVVLVSGSLLFKYKIAMKRKKNIWSKKKYLQLKDLRWNPTVGQSVR